MTTQDQDNALRMEKAFYHGQICAFERIEGMLQDRNETLVRIIGKGNLDHPWVTRLIEIGMFLDEVKILKRRVREAHAEALTR